MEYVKSESVGDVYKEERFEGTVEEIGQLIKEMKKIKNTVSQLTVEVDVDTKEAEKVIDGLSNKVSALAEQIERCNEV